MFDSIWFRCKECGKKIEAQSKSGKCCLDSFDSDSVPEDVAQDANRHAPFSCECGCRYEFEIPEKTVRLRIKKLT